MGSWGNFGCFYQMDIKPLMAYSLASLHNTSYLRVCQLFLAEMGKVVKKEMRPLFKNLMVAGQGSVPTPSSCESRCSKGTACGKNRGKPGCWQVGQLLL